MESPRSSKFRARKISSMFSRSVQRLSKTIDSHRSSYELQRVGFDLLTSVEQTNENEQTDKNDTNVHYDNYMLWSARIGDEKLVQHLLKKNAIHKHMSDHIDRTAVHLATLSGNIEVLRLFLEAGFDVNARDGFGRTPLYYTAMQRPSLQAATMLFRYGAVIQPRMNPTDLGLFLALVSMAKPTDTEENLIKLLLKHGARLEDPNAPGKRQGLHYAAMANNIRMIHFLLDLGADQSSRNASGMTPHDVAVFFGCRDAVYYLENIGIQHILPNSSDSWNLNNSSHGIALNLTRHRYNKMLLNIDRNELKKEEVGPIA